MIYPCNYWQGMAHGPSLVLFYFQNDAGHRLTLCTPCRIECYRGAINSESDLKVALTCVCTVSYYLRATTFFTNSITRGEGWSTVLEYWGS